MTIRALILRMARALPPDIDLGDEREVERALLLAEFWPSDIDQHLSKVIDVARALPILERSEFSTVVIG